MIDAPVGTGKTFTESTIAASLRARGTLVLFTASTGIAALILPGGLTAHSTVKLPFGPSAVSGSTCVISKQSLKELMSSNKQDYKYGTNAQCQANMLLKL